MGRLAEVKVPGYPQKTLQLPDIRAEKAPRPEAIKKFDPEFKT